MKIAEAIESRGERRLAKAGVVNVSTKDEASLSAELKKLADGLGVEPGPVWLNLPRHLAIVRFLTLPSTNPDEIRQMSKLEALRQLPYSEEDILCGFRIAGKTEDGYSKVLLAVVQRKTVERYTKILEGAGLTLGRLALGSESLFAWFSQKGLGRTGAQVVVHCDDHYLDIDIVRDGELVFTRGVLFEAGPAFDREKMAEEIKVSLLSYQKESGLSADRLYLGGPVEKIKPHEKFFQQLLNLPVEVLDAAHDIPEEISAAVGKDVSLAELSGLVLSPENIQVDLAPPEAAAAAKFETLKADAMLTAILLIAIALTVGLLTAKFFYDERMLASFVTGETKKSKSSVIEAEKIVRVINAVRTHVGAPYAFEVWNEIHSLVPPGVSFYLFDFEAGKGLTLRGSAPSLDGAFKLVEILNASEHFQNVKVKYVTKRKEGQNQSADFEFTMDVTAQNAS